MDDDLYSRNHDAVRRARELIDQVDDTLAQRVSRPFDQPDALEAWRDGMPKPKAKGLSPEEIRRLAANREAAQTKAELEKFMREVRAYRDGLEKALGCVIANQRNENKALRKEIVDLREEVAQLSPPVRLAQPQRTIGSAVSA